MPQLRSWHRKRMWCLCLRFDQLLCFHETLCGERSYSAAAEWSVIPLIRSSFTTALCVCKHPRIDVGAHAVLGEHADSAHVSKNRFNKTPRPEPLRWTRDWIRCSIRSPKMVCRWCHHDWKGQCLASVCYIWAWWWGKLGSSCSSGSPRWPNMGSTIQMQLRGVIKL